MPSILIHIGAPKTGTTALQRGLVVNREALLDSGVLVPHRGWDDFRGSHHNLAYELGFGGGISKFRKERGGWADVLEEWASHPGTTLFVTSEAFFRGDLASIQRLLKTLDGHDVHLFSVFRRQDASVDSSFNQLERFDRAVGFTSPRQYFEHRSELWNYEHILTQWSQRAGDARMHAVTYGVMSIEESLQRVLMHVSQRPIAQLQPVPGANARASNLQIAMVKVLGARCRERFGSKFRVDRESCMRIGRYARDEGGEQQSGPSMSLTDAIAIFDACQASNNRFIELAGGPSELVQPFNPPTIAEYPSLPKPTIGPDALAIIDELFLRIVDDQAQEPHVKGA